MSGCSPTRFRGLTRFAFGGDVIETKRVDRHTSGPSNVAEPQEGSVHVVEAFSRSGMRFTVLDEGRRTRRQSCSCTGSRRVRNRGSVFHGHCSRPVTGSSHRTSVVTPGMPGLGPGRPTGSTSSSRTSWPLSMPRGSTGFTW
jgi:hypothetical protein